MILDTSAIVALFLRESDAEALAAALGQADGAGVSAATLLEASIVLSHRLGTDVTEPLQRFIRRFDVRVLPLEEAHWLAATQAWLRFGKGRHPARLNFGDCISYATAQIAEAPLLFKGDDFGRTDVVAALPARSCMARL